MTRDECIRECQRKANQTGRPQVFQDCFGFKTEIVWPSKPILYLTGATTPSEREVSRHGNLGLLVTPDSRIERHIGSHPAGFAVDNGMFGLAKRHQEAKFDQERFYRWLDTLPRTALFVAAPDVLHFIALQDGEEVPVGDAAATLVQYPVHARRIRAMGFKVALVGQDGIEALLDEIPWDLVDAIFLGGSDAWKLGPGAKALIDQAKLRGCHVHMGRVNSFARLQLAQDLGCDTADGTFITYGGDINVWRLQGWISDLRMTAGHFTEYTALNNYNPFAIVHRLRERARREQRTHTRQEAK